MNKVRELKTDSTLWATPAKLVNLLDFKPENGGFYLIIDNIKRYFSFIDNNVVLDMILSNDDQKNKYRMERNF